MTFIGFVVVLNKWCLAQHRFNAVQDPCVETVIRAAIHVLLPLTTQLPDRKVISQPRMHNEAQSSSFLYKIAEHGQTKPDATPAAARIQTSICTTHRLASLRCMCFPVAQRCSSSRLHGGVKCACLLPASPASGPSLYLDLLPSQKKQARSPDHPRALILTHAAATLPAGGPICHLKTNGQPRSPARPCLDMRLLL